MRGILLPAEMSDPFRKTTQALAPPTHTPIPGAYNLYPGYPIGPGKIELGFGPLAQRLASHEKVVMDGMGGVLWDDVRARLESALASIGVRFEWLDVRQALKPVAELNQFLELYLGGDDPLFGTRSPRS